MKLHKHLALVLAASLALAVGACSSSSDNGGGGLEDNLRTLLGIGADADVEAAVRAALAAAAAVQAAAEAAQATAEMERDAANAAAAAAAAAQATAESERDAANAAQAIAEAASAAALAAQEAAQAAAAAAAQAQGMAEAERDAANAAAAAAQMAADEANAAAMAANDAAAAATMRAETAEADAAMKAQEAMDANAAAEAAAMAQAEAEMQRDSANDARDAALALLDAGQAEAAKQIADALAAQAAAEAERDEAIAERNAAFEERGAAVAARDAAIEARDAAQAALETAMMDDEADDAEIARLMGEVSDLNDQISGLNQDIMDKDGEISRLTMMIDGDGTDANPGLRKQVADLQKELQDLKDKIAEQEADQAIETRKANAEKLNAAINVATAGPDNIPGNTDDVAPSAILPLVADMADTISGITAKRDAAGTVTVTAMSTPKIASGSSAAGSSWTEVMLSRSIEDTAEDEIAVYTDIGTPQTWPITADYESATDRFVDIGDATDGTEHPLSEMTATVQPGAGGGFSYADDATFPGTYRGIPGTFTCETGCSVSADEDGAVTFVGDYEFVPTNNLATYDRQDATYNSFGWWLRKPESGAWEVRLFVFGQDGNTAVEAPVALTGSAKYSGMAAGKYTTESFSAGVQTDADAGHFTADASLTAAWGDASAAGTVSGTIDSFDVSGSSNATHWKVTLGSTGDTGATAVSGTGAFGGSTSATFGGATHPSTGLWTGNFYGADGTNAPGTVAGTFDVDTPGAKLIGAFGANK